MRRAALALVTMFAGLATLAAQQTFRTRTDLVSVYATVVDKGGRLVTDLTASDFEVRDNGTVQDVTFFSNDLQPITIIVMLDRSRPMVENFVLVQDAAEQFIRKLMPGDEARVGNFSRDILIRPPKFSSDQDVLLDALGHTLQPTGPSPLWTSIDRSITELLAETERRVVLVFSDGHDRPAPGQAATRLEDVMRRAEVEEVMVYAIGVAEMEGGAYLGPPNRYGVHQRVGGTVIKPDPGLRRLADQSGGGYSEIQWNENLGATFTRVADELHHQYRLAFPPARLDGETHKLDVTLKRSGLTARARRSYVAEAR